MERNLSFCYCLLALALVISTVSLVLNIIIFSMPSVLLRDNSMSTGEQGGQSQSQADTSAALAAQLANLESGRDGKAYVFAYDVPWKQYQFVTKEGELRGLSIDIVEAVCNHARKKCHHIVMSIEYCWNSEKKIGTGLLGQWIDACAVFLKTTARDSTFSFSGRFYKPRMGMLYSKSGSNLRADNIDQYVVGVREHWYVSSSCLKKHGLNPSSVLTAADHRELESMLNNGTVDVAFVEEETYDDNNELTGWSELYDCSLGWSGVMHRVDSDIPLWFNPAFESIKKLGVFKDLCEKYDEVKDTCLHN